MVLFDRSEGKIAKALSGHSKRVASVQFAPKHSNVLVSAGADKTAKVWRAPSEGNEGLVDLTKFQIASTFKEHSGEITALSMHPTSTYFVTASADKTWSFYDMESELCLTQVSVYTNLIVLTFFFWRKTVSMGMEDVLNKFF